MSRVGLNGICGRALPEEDDFQFGVLPDDDSEGSVEGDEIDAVNDETFGADVSSLTIDDLEQYSKQTEGLQLQDGPADWTDEPSCSVSAPDPSQLPIPPFIIDDTSSTYRLASSFNDSNALSASYQLNLGTVDSLWRNCAEQKSHSAWAAPELTSAITQSAFDFINKTDSIVASEQRHTFESAGVKAPKTRTLAAIPKGALTLEEVERNHIQLARRSSLPIPPPPLPSEGAMTVTDFERRLLMESANTNGMPQGETGDRRLPSQPPPSHPSAQQRIPPFPIMPFPFVPPFFAQTLRAHLSGQLPELPPGFPSVPPQMRAAFVAALAQNVTQGTPPAALFGQPPPMIAPPFRPVQRPPILRPSHSHAPLPPHLHYQTPHQMGRVANIYYRDPQSKRAGLPSGKTISDFAFDPYAGFMSRKEREWLVKIQSLQCQGCGNPYEDDFYYTMWRQRKLTDECRAHGLKVQKSECDFSATVVNAHHYVPPTFEGSLGRPTLPTASYPRHVIDVHNDAVDEEERNNTRTSSQKKLRAILMQLEGVAVLLIECEDRKRQLSSGTSSSELHAQLSEEVKTRVDAAVEFLTSHIRTALVVNKGRQMLARTLALTANTQIVPILETLFATLPALLRKVDSDELNSSLGSVIFESISRLSKDNLIVLLRSLPIKEIAKTDASNSSNALFITILLSILICCARKKFSFALECPSSSLYSWLLGTEGICPLNEEWTPTTLSPLTIGADDMHILRTWLESNFMSRPASMAVRMARILHESCEQLEECRVKVDGQ
uniref:Uncharacterized protein n=2 Tax=Parascaris univalens TaxID=6257 RepID=A0A915AMY2_PARUN